MKVSVKSSKVYTLRVGSLELPTMDIASQWEGLVKLVDGKGQHLIVAGLQDLGSVISETFGLESDLTIVQGSPALVSRLLEAAKEAA